VAAVAAAVPAQDLPFVFKPAGEVAVAMEASLGIAIGPDDRLYVTGSQGLRVLAPEGRVVMELQTAEPVRCVAVDADGTMYLGVLNKVEKRDPTGKFLAVWGAERKMLTNSHITGIAIHGALIAAADAGSRKVRLFAADGDPVDELEGFVIPSPYFDCAFGPDGVLYVTHTGARRVELYDANRARIAHWGESGEGPDRFCGCCNPTNLAVFPDGRVAASEKGNPRVKVCDASGRLLAFLGPENFTPETAGLDLAIDSKGRLAVLDPPARKVRYFEIVAAAPAPGVAPAGGGQEKNP
jgi:sugar lactone lactonase YvrE